MPIRGHASNDKRPTRAPPPATKTDTVEIMDALPRSQDVALRWLDERRRVVAATLIETLGSAPLDPGAEMLVDDTGRIEGSVTGGCVEGALVEEATRCSPGDRRTVSYGITDEQAIDVGLVCGGTVQLFVHELTEAHRDALTAVREAVEDGRPVALATILDGEHAGAKVAVLEDRTVGALDGPLTRSVVRDARGFLDEGRSAIRRSARAARYWAPSYACTSRRSRRHRQ